MYVCMYVYMLCQWEEARFPVIHTWKFFAISGTAQSQFAEGLHTLVHTALLKSSHCVLGTGSVKGDFGNLLDFLMQLQKMKVCVVSLFTFQPVST